MGCSSATFRADFREIKETFVSLHLKEVNTAELTPQVLAAASKPARILSESRTGRKSIPFHINSLHGIPCWTITVPLLTSNGILVPFKPTAKLLGCLILIHPWLLHPQETHPGKAFKGKGGPVGNADMKGGTEVGEGGEQTPAGALQSEI